MNLFFETSGQARIFLATVPVGFLLAICFDAVARAGCMRPVLDVLCLLGCGVAVIGLMLVFRDEGLRLYHALALLVGAGLYLFGVGRLIHAIAKRVSNRKKHNQKIKMEQKPAGDSAPASK